MTEESAENQITFVDTNIILPQSCWRFYREHLDQHRDEGRLSYNTDISEGALEDCLTDTENAIQMFRKLDNPKVTRGVLKQVAQTTEKSVENIFERRLDFLFTIFNKLTPEQKRPKATQLYESLRKYSENLEELKKLTSENEYASRTESFFIISNFLSGLKENFYEVGKENHKFDFGADDEIVASGIQESLINDSQVNIVSNDRDVRNLLGLFCSIIQIAKPAINQYPIFKKFLNKTPRAYSCKDLAELIEEEVIDFSGEKVRELAGFQGYLDTTELKSAYHSKVASLARILDRTVIDLVESLENKAR